MASIYPSAPPSATPSHSIVCAALLAGSVAAAVEMVPVLGIQAMALGVQPARVFQSIASGLLGAAAYRGGLATVLAGVALHWLISVGAALVFAWTASRWRDLAAHPAVAGIGLGVLAFAVMTALVVPLSASAFPPNRNPVLILVSLAVHILFFGLPIALVVARRLRPDRGAA